MGEPRTFHDYFWWAVGFPAFIVIAIYYWVIERGRT